MPFPGIFPVTLFSADNAFVLEQVLSSTDNADGSFTLPNGIQAGDLIVVWDTATGGPPTAVTPSGFTNNINVSGSSERGMLSHKIADGSEGGTSVTGMNGVDGEVKLVYVFRGSRPIVSVSVLDMASQITSANPTAQTVNASGATPPLVVLGGYASVLGTVDPRTFTVNSADAKDGEISATGGFINSWLAYKIYNNSPADVVVDMDDEGASDILASCYITIT